MDILYHPIGITCSPFTEIEGAPIQPSGATGIRGRLEIFPEFLEGLQGVAEFSHLIVLYHLHRVRDTKLTVTPFLYPHPQGVFATRAPVRPNPIGLSVLKLLEVRGNILHVENIDILDETPLLDIKPYVPAFDRHACDRIGWYADAEGDASDVRADDRFR